MDTFVKERTHAPDQFFEAEAAGLRWLAEAESSGGARTVRVVDVAPGRIELERIQEARPTRDQALPFGRALAITHDAGSVTFGAPPTGHSGPLYIGSREMPSGTAATWGEFYAPNRVLPFLDPALAAGNLREEEAVVVREACALLEAGALDDGEPPARIHGDLWAGNVMWSADGVVLIDPAAHGGHRETDLAMLALFGAPHLESILEGYQQVHPLREGWRARIPAHQLHPLAVHAAGHGRSYGVELTAAARRTLALAEC
ncbi:fructosamine kinase family protein [Micrococcus terreus]|uniref:fructosamine kinase family protein n=1 Tax=Micrococcus terreus TaxID=574650 RepID=UPI00254F2163|nr:fructosamine kinase family protein [Micrococcus terreus]MDK7700534.1 fructosamine kinase family protein [Micrococcus terreus]WOO97602.1 fructosamine kinase family protein [Micrococcus terreus]